MGWLIFFGLLLIGCIYVGIERLARGQKKSKINKNKVTKVQKHKHKKKLPPMMYSDDDSEELQEFDDMMVMDALDEDD